MRGTGERWRGRPARCAERWGRRYWVLTCKCSHMNPGGHQYFPDQKNLVRVKVKPGDSNGTLPAWPRSHFTNAHTEPASHTFCILPSHHCSCALYLCATRSAVCVHDAYDQCVLSAYLPAPCATSSAEAVRSKDKGKAAAAAGFSGEDEKRRNKDAASSALRAALRQRLS